MVEAAVKLLDDDVIVHLLRAWSTDHPEFVVGSNEAGMKLGEDIRAADAAVWRRADVSQTAGRLQRVPPVLAVEIAGEDEDEHALQAKARWYLGHEVHVVWIVLPGQRNVLVVGRDGEVRRSRGRLPVTVQLPDLAPDVDQFFVQLDQR